MIKRFTTNIFLGFQHILTMFPASIVVPMILGTSLNLDKETMEFLVSANLLTNGFAVLINSYGVTNKIGSKIPLVFGSSFVPLAPMIMIGSKYGIQTLFGSVIGSAILMFILSLRMSKILKLFPPVVVGSFVTLIGISLAPIAFKNLGGGDSADYGSIRNLLIGLGVFFAVILIGRYGRGVAKTLSVTLGIAFGTVFAYFLGIVNFSPIIDAKWINIVKPFAFGLPSFKFNTIIIMTIFCIINLIQCVGVLSLYDEVTGSDIGEKTKTKALRSQMLAQGIAGIFNSFPSAMFNENVGLLNITRNKSIAVTKFTGFILILLGIFPKCAALITVIPPPVVGGATLALFGIITAAGISMLSSLDLTKNNNFTIIGTSIVIGVGTTFVDDLFSKLPDTLEMLLGNGLFMVSASAIILNYVLNIGKRKERNIES